MSNVQCYVMVLNLRAGRRFLFLRDSIIHISVTVTGKLYAVTYSRHCTAVYFYYYVIFAHTFLYALVGLLGKRHRNCEVLR